MRAKRIRVLVAHPSRLAADAFAAALGREPDIVPSGTVLTMAGLLAATRVLRPDVAVANLHFEDGSALEAAGALRRRRHRVRLVVLSPIAGTGNDAFEERAAKLGVRALSKAASYPTAVEAIRRAAIGDPPMTESRLARLTARQLEVLRRIARGQSTGTIARDLGLTAKGVESHRYRIMNRLGVRDRVGLTRLAIRAGLVAP